MVHCTHVGASGRRSPSRIDGSGPSIRRHSRSQRRKFFARSVSGREVRIRVSELGDEDLGPRRVLTGFVSGDHALDRVSESVLGVFDKG